MGDKGNRVLDGLEEVSKAEKWQRRKEIPVPRVGEASRATGALVGEATRMAKSIPETLHEAAGTTSKAAGY